MKRIIPRIVTRGDAVWGVVYGVTAYRSLAFALAGRLPIFNGIVCALLTLFTIGFVLQFPTRRQLDQRHIEALTEALKRRPR